jgi:hypothetical protein
MIPVECDIHLQPISWWCGQWTVLGIVCAFVVEQNIIDWAS